MEAGSLRVGTSDGFFAAQFRDARSGEARVYLFRRHPWRFGEWERTPYPVTLDAPMRDPVLAMGVGFAAVADAGARQLKVVAWSDALGRWTEQSFGTGSAGHLALAAAPQVVLAGMYDDAAGRLRLALYHVGADGRWVAGGTHDETVPIDWKVTTPQSLLAAGPSFCAAAFVKSVDSEAGKVRYGVRVFTWTPDAAFDRTAAADGEQELPLVNPIGVALVQGSVVGSAQHLFRFDGARWQTATLPEPRTGNAYSYAYGDDVALAGTQAADGTVSYTRSDYSPYQNAWGPARAAGEPVSAGKRTAPPSASGGFATAGRRLYWRTPTGAWQEAYTLPASADLETLADRAPSYLAWQDAAGSATTVLLLHDAAAAGSVPLSGERIHVPSSAAGTMLAGAAAFVTYAGDDFDRAQVLHVYRVVGGRLDAHLSHATVERLRIDDGYAVTESAYAYDVATATYDAAALVAQFVGARQQAGGGEAGWTRSTFFNGLAPEVPGVVYPPSDEFSNARSFFSALNGQLCRSEDFTSGGRAVRVVTQFPYVYAGGIEGSRFAGALTRLRRTVEEQSLRLFDADPAFAAGLDRRTVPPGLADAFAAHGFPLAAPVQVTVEAQGRLWTLAPGASWSSGAT